MSEAERLAERLRELLAKATPGTLIAHGWGDGSTQMGMTNIFNEDAEILLMECIPEADAALIVEAVNALPTLLARIAALEEFVAMCAEMTPEEFLPNGEYERGNLSRAYKAGRFDSIQRKAMKLNPARKALGKVSE